MFKKLLATLALTVGFVSGAQALSIDLVNNSTPQVFSLGQNIPVGDLAPGQSSNTTFMTFDYLDGGTFVLKLLATNPNDSKSSLRLTGGDLSGFIAISLDGLGDVFTQALAAGTYTLQVMLNGANPKNDRFEISAVPLPGAALLFATSMAGFMAARKRRRTQQPVA